MGEKVNDCRSYGVDEEADMEIEGWDPDLAGWTRRVAGARGMPWKDEELSKRANLWGLEVRVEAMVAI